MRVIFNILTVVGIVALLFLIFRSAAHDTTRPIISARLSPYVDRWEREMRAAGINYERAFNRIESIREIETGEAYAGMTDLSAACIKINSKQLETGSMRTLCTVYHELGHYVFQLEHGSCEIMGEKCPPEEYLLENWVKLQQEYIASCRGKRFEANN